MARISDDDVRRVREATDLVSLVGERVVLRQKNRLFWGCCPFHDEKTPSFKIDPATQLWHCFGCGKGGDVFGYVMESEHLEFPEAVRLLADRAHIELHETGASGIPRGKKERLMQACAEAASYYHMQLMRSRSAGAASARAYLHDRGFGSGPSKKWNLGYAPGHGALVRHLRQKGFTANEIIEANLGYMSKSNRLVDRFYERVMFPVQDMQERTIAFGGRVIGTGEPKYLNTSGTPIFQKSSNMFGIEKAKTGIVASKCAVVVEGYTDVIAMHEAGITNVVATLGTALTSQHVRMLSRFATSIIYLFDGDAAGQKAADRASEFIDWNSAVESSRNPIDLKVVVLPDNLDPMEFITQRGADAMREQLAQAEPLLRYSILRRIGTWDLNSPSQKARALNDALQILYPLKNSISATDYINLIADALNVGYAAVAKALGEMKAPAAARREDRNQAQPEPKQQPVNRAVRAVVEADQQYIRMEHELMSLIVVDMRLLDAIDRDVARISWQDPASEKMADVLLSMDHGASPADALFAAQKVVPDASVLLAEAMNEQNGHEERLVQARLLLGSLRERDLERKIAAAKARLRDETLLSPEEADEIFKRTIGWQKELTGLRNGSLGTQNEKRS